MESPNLEWPTPRDAAAGRGKNRNAELADRLAAEIEERLKEWSEPDGPISVSFVDTPGHVARAVAERYRNVGWTTEVNPATATITLK